jgi:hypothetical protein
MNLYPNPKQGYCAELAMRLTKIAESRLEGSA